MIVPILIYSLVAIELPSSAGEENVDPCRDIPIAIGRAGVGRLAMYAVPILAVLLVVPVDRLSSLNGLIDAMKSVSMLTMGAHLLIFPAFVALRIRQPNLARPLRVPGGLGAALLASILSTSWAMSAVVCLLWPGFGTSNPDDALPAGFEGDRATFEVLVLIPVLAMVPICAGLYALGRSSRR